MFTAKPGGIQANKEFHCSSTSTLMHAARICAFALNRIGIPCLPKPVYSTGFGSQCVYNISMLNVLMCI